LAKQLYWPARYLDHERHHPCTDRQLRNRGEILEHQELLTASPQFSDDYAQARTRARDFAQIWRKR
jgi:hypothetical protein